MGRRHQRRRKKAKSIAGVDGTRLENAWNRGVSEGRGWKPRDLDYYTYLGDTGPGGIEVYLVQEGNNEHFIGVGETEDGPWAVELKTSGHKYIAPQEFDERFYSSTRKQARNLGRLWDKFETHIHNIDVMTDHTDPSVSKPLGRIRKTMDRWPLLYDRMEAVVERGYHEDLKETVMMFDAFVDEIADVFSRHERVLIEFVDWNDVPNRDDLAEAIGGGFYRTAYELGEELGDLMFEKGASSCKRCAGTGGTGRAASRRSTRKQASEMYLPKILENYEVELANHISQEIARKFYGDEVERNKNIVQVNLRKGKTLYARVNVACGQSSIKHRVMVTLDDDSKQLAQETLELGSMYTFREIVNKVAGWLEPYY